MGASINIGSIMDKVYAYSTTPAGIAVIDKLIKEYMKHGIRKTRAGSKIITADEMEVAVNKMLDILLKTARSYDLPTSVMNHLDTAKCHVEQIDDESFGYIAFGGDLHRNSLYPAKYDGIDNIVALFNNGYEAGDYVYGLWIGHPPNAVYADPRSTETAAFVRSRKIRQPLLFIQQAINDFNRNYGASYNVKAIAASIYET